ncbi:Phosphopantothenoylcysteine decarboxylase, partial [Mucuna pruriens]
MDFSGPACKKAKAEGGYAIPRKPRILLAACGNGAAGRFGNICRCFTEWAEVKAVVTKSAVRLIPEHAFPKDTVDIYCDEHEWCSWKKIGDPVLHIELRGWADIMVIAPLSAEILGKIAGGMCDDLLTCIVRAWDYSKPLFVAPCMDSFTWRNPPTERLLTSFDDLGVSLNIIPPVTRMTCDGELEHGVMAATATILSTVRAFYENELKKQKKDTEIRGVVTKSSLHFIDKATIPSGVFVYYDDYEWYSAKGMDIELLNWADVMVIAPLSAHTLAKIARGLCDDLLSSTVRAWDPNKKLIFVAPSMNPSMWTNPFTEDHCVCIDELGICLIRPDSVRTATGEYKIGAMAEPSFISRTVRISYNNLKAVSEAAIGVPRKPRVLLAACGCLDATKFGLLCQCFMEWAEVRGIITKSSLRYIERASIPNAVSVYYDEPDWFGWKGMDEDLLRWADILVIAPLSAHILAKVAAGLCDDLLTSIVRAWHRNSKPIYFAPSMNPFMWKNPFTQRHRSIVEELGIFVIGPVSQAKGEYKIGAMAEPSDISLAVRISYSTKLQGNNMSSSSVLYTPRKPRVLLAACGCIAAAKFGLLCQCFLSWARVRGVATQSSLRFLDAASMPDSVVLYFVIDNCLVELLEWADIMVIAPLSARTLAKIAGGFCDDLLTSIVRGWDYRKPFFVAPSMHHWMWKNPFTEKQCNFIENLGISLIQPLSQTSASGEYETGEMAEPSDISYTVKISNDER